jgi:hypothetical protein
MAERYTTLPGADHDGDYHKATVAAWCNRVTGMLVVRVEAFTDTMAVIPGGCDPKTGKELPQVMNAGIKPGKGLK